MKLEQVFLIGLITIIIGFVLYYIIGEFTGTEKFEKTDNTPKVLQYFGGEYCPFSNTDSNAYKVIKEFEDEYENKLSVKYYWVGKDDDLMKQMNIKYVPTILNNDNKQIELELPTNTDTTDLSTNELKQLLFETIYNKL